MDKYKFIVSRSTGIAYRVCLDTGEAWVLQNTASPYWVKVREPKINE